MSFSAFALAILAVSAGLPRIARAIDAEKCEARVSQEIVRLKLGTDFDHLSANTSKLKFPEANPRVWDFRPVPATDPMRWVSYRPYVADFQIVTQGGRFGGFLNIRLDRECKYDTIQRTLTFPGGESSVFEVTLNRCAGFLPADQHPYTIELKRLCALYFPDARPGVPVIVPKEGAPFQPKVPGTSPGNPASPSAGVAN